MVEGEGGNIIIDTTDDVSQAKEVLSEFQKINQNPIKAIIYTHNHGDHVFGASEFYNAQEEKPLVIAHSTTCLLYTSPSPRDVEESRMPSSA